MANSLNTTSTHHDVPRSSSAAQLTVAEGCTVGARYKVEDSATIGRSPDATIMLDDPEVSRLHARLLRTVDGFFQLEDLKSRNGTFVNGTRVDRRVVEHGDKIRFGPHVLLEFHVLESESELITQRQRFEALGRFAIGITHDLNNVLAALDAGASYLQASPLDQKLGDSAVRECIADLVAATRRASELTRSLLAFARGRGTDRGVVDLSALVGEVVKMLRHMLDQSIRIELLVAPNALVHSSKSELYQVLLNLCLNARDAMPSGGLLRVSAAPVLDPQTPVMGWQRGRPAAVVSVADSGVGMDAETQTRIFEPFFTTKRDGAGCGLGLATVREIVMLHGGQIGVRSSPGRGAEFTIYLPMLDPSGLRWSNTREMQPTATIRRDGGALSILLVDDEEIVRRSVGRLLRHAGFEVTSAADGAEAVARYALHPHDLVLLDLDMPELNGEETQQRLMALDPDVQIVFASGHVDPTREALVRARGALGLLEKPFGLEALVTLAKRAESRDSGADPQVRPGPS